MGVEKSKKIYLHIEAGKHDSLPDGLVDNTHFSQYGALEMAWIAAAEMEVYSSQLAKYLKP
ncbi:MAG: hypothetical protein ACOC0C_00495 [Bacteroidota bacterium]